MKQVFSPFRTEWIWLSMLLFGMSKAGSHRVTGTEVCNRSLSQSVRTDVLSDTCNSPSGFSIPLQIVTPSFLNYSHLSPILECTISAEPQESCTFETCSKHAQDMLRTCSGHAQDMFRTTSAVGLHRTAAC